MRDFFKKFKQYLKMPEMKILWLFLFLVFLIFIIDVFYLEPFWTLVSLTVLLSVGAVIFAVNIRSAKANYAVKKGKIRIDNIISGMRDGVIIYNQDFEIELFNKGAQSIFNLNEDETVGKKLSPESVRDPRFGILAKVIFQSLAPSVVQETPEGAYPQIVNISFEEPRLELKVVTDKMFDENGQITGFLKITRDQTREMELLRSKSDFITIAAHQLRTPLSAVNWAFQSLKSESLTESQKELVETGSAASNNLLKIVEDLLNISKIEEGKFGYNFQEIDIVKFLESAINQTGPIAKEYNVRAYMENPAESPIMATVDPEKLVIAVSNLLENAIKYNIPNGQVVLSVEQRKDKPFIRINVADTGMGISEEDLNKLFTKFFRGEKAVSRVTEGSGLGLYMVKNIIRRHGGEIWAESVVGRGSVFHFTLPTDPGLIPQREIV
ncbi:MAG: ATP-binding protein [Patescibacteria group bacterium]